jgi:1-acyl-sn-glycerol-3-phosphate acyltransferase
VSAAAPRPASRPLPLPRRTLRAVRVVAHVAVGLATTTFVFPRVSALRRRELVRSWSDRLLALLAVEPELRGDVRAPGGNVLIVANHVSWLDIFVLLAHQPARFVAKSELARWPFAGRLMREAGTIFVERARRHDTRRVNHHATQALEAGDVVAVFPEGTTTDGLTVLRFHASLLQPIVESDGSVLPVAIRYRDDRHSPSPIPTYGEESFAASFWRVCGSPRLVAELHVAEPVPVRGRHRRELAREAEAAIRSALGLEDDASPPGTSDRRPGGTP